jgi:inorganic pyrophosphatase
MPKSTEDYTRMFQHLVGYSLGVSSVALFCRVGGGIYKKYADVGADLVGKVNSLFSQLRYNLKEDSPENPATIADNVGDNVGDITGMGSDLLCSLTGTLCAALVISSTSEEFVKNKLFYFPFVIAVSGIIICIISSLFATQVMKVTNGDNIETALKSQLLISTVLLTPMIFFLTLKILPETVTLYGSMITNFNKLSVICILCGLWSGLIIAYVTDYYTSSKNQYFII